ncbi:ATP-grasp domain-containing protein [Nonomuraea sp. NPDC048826]|uniref:ATP-grasp domain-containing protein n=1 Tax=Nonomuraea sp. NPDC048826 TaxID=3364347 RepID=UPI003715122F
MRILLSDGSGVTSRQCATVLSRAGHHVEVLSPDPLCLCAFTRHVRRVHRVPFYGADPYGWLETATGVYRKGGFDVLLPTQEQVAVLARERGAGTATVVPPFAALAAVQDKVSAHATLARLGVPQPDSAVVRDLAEWDGYPAYVKRPIGTASSGVRRLAGPGERLDGPWAGEPELLVQREVEGPLAMVQSVFDGGSQVAFHACLRVREGARGGAGHKLGVALPEVREHVRALGEGLGWHGALSADVVLGADGPVFIDVNPRLVEPVNALLSGVDLVTPLLDLALGRPVLPQPAGTPGVRTHQVLLALLGAAARGRGAVLAELVDAVLRRGSYEGGTEELTPGYDPRAMALVAAAAGATLVRPGAWRWFTSGSVSAYALEPDGWRAIADPARDDQPNRSRIAGSEVRTNPSEA